MDLKLSMLSDSNEAKNKSIDDPPSAPNNDTNQNQRQPISTHLTNNNESKQQKYQETIAITNVHNNHNNQSTNINISRCLSFDDEIPSCRICHCTESPSSGLVKLISPCHCSGSLKYVHHGCLQQWLDATNSQTCELCKQPFSITIKYKPIYKWNALNASPGERRRLVCNSVFNLVSMACIFWSIYVLIERASLDAQNGQIDWSFYVKISVVTIGLIIGVIFLFVQLKLYFTILMKWRQSNRIIVIRNSNYIRPINITTTTATARPQNTNQTNSNSDNNTNNNNSIAHNETNQNNTISTRTQPTCDLTTTSLTLDSTTTTTNAKANPQSSLPRQETTVSTTKTTTNNDPIATQTKIDSETKVDSTLYHQVRVEENDGNVCLI